MSLFPLKSIGTEANRLYGARVKQWFLEEEENVFNGSLCARDCLGHEEERGESRDAIYYQE